jgi:hypothetical protein
MPEVLHVINNLETGGAEKLLKNIIPVLHKKGMKCSILTLDGKDTYISQELSEKNHVILNYIGKGLNIYNPLIIFKIRPYLKNYEIIHVHLFPSQYWIAIAKKIFPSKSVLITTEHSPDNRRRKLLIFRLFEQFIYRQYKYVVAVSNNTAENLRKYLNVSGERIRIVENGIDLRGINDALPYLKDELIPGCDENTKLILNVARFHKSKDHATLIKSMLHLPGDHHLVLVGEGELKSRFLEYAKELNLESRVHFLGARTDVERILKTVDIVVMSSFYEGLSLSAIEGMASKKPLIASDVAGLREIVEDTGLLYEPGNPEDLAEKVMLILGNKDLSEMIIKRCTKKALSYNIERTADSYIELYQSVLSEIDSAQVTL